MQVILDSVEEESVHRIWRLIGLACHLVLATHFSSDPHKLILWVDIWHDTSIQHVLDVFKEALLNDIVIREQENSFQLVSSSLGSIVSTKLVNLLELVAEGLEIEVFPDLELLSIHVRDEGRESGQRVSTTATNSHQQSMTSF